MGVNLYSLFVDLQARGVGTVMADLRGVDAAGIKTAASLNGVAGSLDRTASAALNGTKGFKDNAAAYANQDKVLASLTPATVAVGNATEEHAAKTKKSTAAAKEHGETLHGLWGTLKQLAGAYFLFEGLHFVGEAVEQAAALHELSQKTGATVETLSVLQFAAKRADVSMSQVSTSFKGMAISLGNLRDGQEKTVAAYERLGFVAKDFEGLNPEQQFLKLAVAVGGVKDETERAEIAQRVFGRSGSQMIPLLVDLAENGFAKTTEEAKKFGSYITGDMATAADKVKDDWNDIVNMFKGLARDVLPAMVLGMQSLNQVLHGSETFWSNTKREIFGVIDGMTRLATLGFWGTHLAEGVTNVHTFDDVEDGGSTTATGPKSPPKHNLTPEQVAARAKARAEAHEKAMLALLDATAPATLAGGGSTSAMRLRTGRVRTPSASAIPGLNDDPTAFMGGSLEGDLSGLFAQGGSGSSTAGRQSIMKSFADEAKRQSVALKVQFATLGQGLGQTLAGSFATGLSAAMSGKNPFVAFGKSVLSGLGSLFSQMGEKLVGYGLIMLKLLPFLSNPFTSGPAAIAAGVALMALGATLGGIAHGSGGSGGGGGGDDFRDRTTQITLTPAGMGGTKAPMGQPGQHFHVIGIDSPQGTTLLGKGMSAAKRMNKA